MLKALNYLFIGYTIIKPAVTALAFSFDGSGRLHIMLTFLVVLLNLNDREFRKSLSTPVVIIWGVWGLYAGLNWIFKGIPHDRLSDFIYLGNCIYLIWFSLLIAVNETRRDRDVFLKFTLYCFICYLLMGLIFQSGASYENSDRQGALLGNMLPLNGLSLFSIASILWITDKITSKQLFLILLLVMSAILFVATRKALGGLFIMIFFLLLAKYSLERAENVFYISVGCLILYIVISVIMANSVLGNRMNDIEKSANHFNTTDIKFLNILGDRAYFYIKGWNLFLKHPFTGIGIGNFAQIDVLKLPFHTEYMSQLAENGIIGTLLYLWFNIRIFQSIVRARIRGIIDSEFWPFIGWMASLLFISLTAWTYSFSHYFIVIGVITGYIQSKENEIEELDNIDC